MDIGASFALFPGETIQLFNDEPEMFPGDKLVLLSLVPVPALPLPGDKHQESKPYALVFASNYSVKTGKTAWGWIYPYPGTKEAIADYLIGESIEPGRWYWLKISPP